MRTFNEVGLGHETILSYEQEYDDAPEVRRPGLGPMGRFRSAYLRVRLFGIELILDTRDVVKVKTGKIGLRLIIGVYGRR